jgi:uncharacterized protein DUF937
MSINLVSLVSQYLTPALIGRISSALGVDRTLIGKAITALAPALLRTLAGLASTPVGAQRLSNEIEKQDPGVLDSLEAEIGGPAQDSLVKGGIGALESLLGGSTLSALTGALSKFSGLGEETASSLIGMLTPAVFGTLHKEQAVQGLDASGLGRMLAAQKENISEALPPELGELLGKAGVPGFEAPPTSQAERPPVPRPASAAEAPQSFNWRLVLAAVAVIALASAWYFGNRPAQVVEQTKPPAVQVTQNLSVDGVDLNSSVQKALDGVKTALQGVRDTASAQTALPQLERSSTEFDKLRTLAAKLPADSKTSFAMLVGQLRPSIEELFNRVLEIPGVAPIAKPVIDGLRAKLDALSKTESKA